MIIGAGQILPFRTIKSNVGNGYDVNTFKFTPPYNGTYEFMLQIMTSQISSSKAEITVNGLDKCRAHTGIGMSVLRVYVCTPQEFQKRFPFFTMYKFNSIIWRK